MRSRSSLARRAARAGIRMLAVLGVAVFSGFAAQAVEITLAWNPNTETNLSAYRLYYGKKPHAYYSSIQVSASAPTVTVSNLENGLTYYFAVSAINAAGFEGGKSPEVAYTVIEPEIPPIVSIIGVTDASEPKRIGTFSFSRVGNVQKPLTVYFSLEGTAVAGVDYRHPGNRITFRAGKTNATLFIRPIADRQFEGAKTLVLSLTNAANIELGSEDSASILIGDDDRPSISIAAVTNAADAGWQTMITAPAYTNLSLILQCSTNLTNWTVVAAPQIQQPIAYLDAEPAAAPSRFYRVIYVHGEISEASIGEALAHQMFSANVVGTVNVAMQPGWNLAANPLNGNKTDGPRGNLPSGASFVVFGSSKINAYQNARWTRGIPLTRSTQGGWFFNPSNEPVNVTYVGEIPGVAVKPTIPAGWSVRSSPVSVTIGEDELLGYPLYSGDSVYEFNASGLGAEMWIPHLRGTNGWDVAPTLTAGRGVLIYKATPTRPNISTPTPAAPSFVQSASVMN